MAQMSPSFVGVYTGINDFTSLRIEHGVGGCLVWPSTEGSTAFRGRFLHVPCFPTCLDGAKAFRLYIIASGGPIGHLLVDGRVFYVNRKLKSQFDHYPVAHPAAGPFAFAAILHATATL